MEDRYDFIKDLDPAKTKLNINWRIKEDLSFIGGPKTVLRLFGKTYEQGSFVAAEAASEVRAFVKEMTSRADEIAEKYGFTTLLRVD